LTTPKEGSRDEVIKIEEDLIDFLRNQPGFQEAYRLNSETKVGRVTVWDSHASADHAASTQHTLALRSRLLPLVAESIEVGLDGERIT
jgi:quinol monooxygenase YgiN